MKITTLIVHFSAFIEIIFTSAIFNSYGNKLIGWSSLTRDPQKKFAFGFRTFSIKFDNVEKFFNASTDKLHYDVNHKPVRAFYADTVYGKVARKLSKKVGDATFTHHKNDVKSNHNYVNIQLKSADQLLKLLGYGRSKRKPIIYNYVLTLNGTLLVAPVYHKIRSIAYLAGKHLILAQGSVYVLYAGDLFIKNGELYLTNNSGSYKPPFKNIGKLVGLIRDVMVDFRIHTMDASKKNFSKVLKQTMK